jgi:hypothetical protein
MEYLLSSFPSHVTKADKPQRKGFPTVFQFTQGTRHDLFPINRVGDWVCDDRLGDKSFPQGSRIPS